MDPRVVRYLFGYGDLKKASPMMRMAIAAGLALGVGFSGAAMAQGLRVPPIAQPARAWLVDHDNDKHEHGKNKHHGQDEEGDDEDRGRSRGSGAPGSWRYYQPVPGYYYPPPATYYRPPAYATPYSPSYAPVAPPTRMGTQPAAPAALSSEPNRTGTAAGSSGPTIQWVDPPPAR